MMFETVLGATIAFAVSLVGTLVVGRIARTHRLLDVPNERSSHALPTPRGGGIAIGVAALTVVSALAATGTVPASLGIALAGGGFAIGLIGYLDDRYQLRATPRFAVHVAAAIWAVAWLGSVPGRQLAGADPALDFIAYVVAVVGIVWSINLFNFMDGIDGLAASEAVFISLAAGVLAVQAGIGGGVAATSVVFGAACAGFLVWNWPPARIFMGDAGSGLIGYFVAILALAAAKESEAAFWTWLALAGVFLSDATVTLVRRLLRGERVYQAHRTHAYQWLARRWSSHRRVTWVVIAINVIWLLPAAWYGTRHRAMAGWAALIAYIPLIALALIGGAGRREPVRRVGPDAPKEKTAGP